MPHASAARHDAPPHESQPSSHQQPSSYGRVNARLRLNANLFSRSPHVMPDALPISRRLHSTDTFASFRIRRRSRPARQPRRAPRPTALGTKKIPRRAVLPTTRALLPTARGALPAARARRPGPRFTKEVTPVTVRTVLPGHLSEEERASVRIARCER